MTHDSPPINLVAMCNCLITEDSCRPAFRILEWNSFRIFSVKRLCVNYSKRITKHADLQSILTITLLIEKTAIRCTKTSKKKMTTDQTITTLLLDHTQRYWTFKIMQHFLCKKTQKTQIKKTDFKSPNTS